MRKRSPQDWLQWKVRQVPNFWLCRTKADCQLDIEKERCAWLTRESQTPRDQISGIVQTTKAMKDELLQLMMGVRNEVHLLKRQSEGNDQEAEMQQRELKEELRTVRLKVGASGIPLSTVSSVTQAMSLIFQLEDARGTHIARQLETSSSLFEARATAQCLKDQLEHEQQMRQRQDEKLAQLEQEVRVEKEARMNAQIVASERVAYANMSEVSYWLSPCFISLILPESRIIESRDAITRLRTYTL